MTRCTRLTSVLFLAASLAFPKRDLEICGFHASRGVEELALHRQAAPAREAKARARARLAQRPSAVRDIGNIAIIEDADGVVERRNPFTLSQRSIRFSANESGQYRFETTSSGYRTAVAEAGTRLDGLADDDSRTIALPFAFRFFGKSHTRIYVNSDGNLTFESPDTSTSDRSLGRLASGAPRIAGFFEDLDPSAAGEVRVTSQPDLFAVSWVGVPEYSQFGNAPRNTFQIVLTPAGTIEIAFQSVATRFGVVGISPGGLQGTSSIVSFSTTPSGLYSGMVAERFSNAEEVDTVTAAQKFFETHDDAYDYLVFYNNLGLQATAGAVAFEVTVRSNRLGIGDSIVDDGVTYGSARRLQAIMNMGPLGQYPRDPNAIVPLRASSRDTSLTVLGHEAGHLFAAFASVRDPADPAARPLLGRQTAHWAFPFNSEASLMEGNRIQDNGPGSSPRFRTVATVEGYAPFDQYLMGFRAPDEVPPTFLVVNPSVGPVNRAPQPGVTFNGERRDVTIEELIAAEGQRIPDHTVAQRHFRFAFILITAAGQEPSAADISQVEAYRAAFEPFFARASGERATAETTLLRNVKLSLAPAGGVVVGATATASLALQRPAEADLTVLLRTRNGVATAPGSVTIRAGSARAAFSVTGVREGVEEFTAEPADTRYAMAVARIAVAGSASTLKLQAVSGGAQSVAAPGSALPEQIVVRAVDSNNVPFNGQAVNAVVTSGTVAPARAVTDEDGLARFTWTPGAGPLHELTATLAAAASASVTVNAIGRPFISTGGVVNSASFAPGISPGSLSSIFGASLAAGITEQATRLPLPDRLGGVQVFVDGQAASLLYISDRQINFVTPSTLVTSATASVSVTRGGETVSINVPLRAAAPGLFTLDTARTGAILVSGTGQTTAQRPAAAGDVVEIYATGLGLVRPSSSFPGLAETVEPVSVTIGGRVAQVLFSGLTPGFQGLYQINARVPDGLTPGSLPVAATLGTATSNEVLIRVR